ncbi:MAG: FkbM family methyltransferase [Bacteroidota bacterium]
MGKLSTYSRYFYDYLSHGDFLSIIASARYIINQSSHKKDRIIQTSIGKFYCRKNTNDFQFANYGYEWGVKKFLLDHIKEYTVFIDGGACVGDYSILLSRFGARCIAFEPVESNFNVLTRNLELNNLTGTITTFPFGLGEVNKVEHFTFDPVNTGASCKSADPASSDCRADIRTFDSLLPELNLKTTDRILFKLDIEGMEAEAIRGAAGFIRLFPNITFVLEDKHTGKDPIEEALREIAGFEIGIVDHFNIYAKKIIA